MRHTLTAIACLLAATAAQAGTLGIHIGSDHGAKQFDVTDITYYPDGTDTREYSMRNYNNFNPGIYYVADNGFTVGTYRNSYYRQTFYAGYTIESDKYLNGLVSGVVTGGFATGYAWVYGYGKLRPMLMPSIKVHFGNTAVRYTALPSDQGLFQHLSIEYKI